MASPAHLWITDEDGLPIKGDSNVKGREGSIELRSLSHSVTQQADNISGKLSGEQMHHPIVLEKELDRVTPFLFRAISLSYPLRAAEIKLYNINDSGVEEEYFSIRLQDVRVLSVHPKLHDIHDASKTHEHLVEVVELRYGKITWGYLDGNIFHSFPSDIPSIPMPPLSKWRPWSPFLEDSAETNGKASDFVAPDRCTEFMRISDFLEKKVSHEAKVLIKKSPGLQNDLKALNDARWRIRYGNTNEGTYANRRDRQITISSRIRDNPSMLTQALAHEGGHALYPYQEDFSSKEAYLTSVFTDEAVATMNNIKVQREILANGGMSIGVSGTNRAIYEAAYDQFLEDGDVAAARKVIAEAFGDEINSVTKQTYKEYYGGWYENNFPKKK